MRGKRAEKRQISPDPIYNSVLLHKFINKVMMSGKKSVAQRLVYKALESIKEETKQDPLSVFEKAVKNITPKIEVRPRRVGGASYLVPVEVRGDRKESLALRWVIASAEGKSNKEFHSFDKKLAREIIDAANSTGGAVKKREEIEKVAAANRAFAHFRW